MSNTPRSDQEWVNSYCEHDQGTVAMYHFAQKLELELASMTAERDALLLELTKVKQRYEWLKGLFSPMSLNIDGNHSWVCRGTISRLKGPNMDEAIDNASGNF